MDENMEDKGMMGNIVRGAAMGVAEVIPGVSGGTIAFITGIYERLIHVLSSFSIDLLKSLYTDGVTTFWKKIDGNFLIQLGVGMVAGIGVGIFGVTYLLEHAPSPLWSFFFGLIAASVIYIFRQTNTKSARNWVLLIVSSIVAYFITSFAPMDGSTNLFYVFISGAIAISALILPGISGSFILLLMGMYTVIIPNVKNLVTDFSSEGFILVAVFALGCLTGLLSFSKVLNYTFKHYKESTLCILSGLMLGSLHKIWPWRNPVEILHKETGLNVPVETYQADLMNEQYKLISEANVLPAEYFSNPMTLLCVLTFIIGFAIVISAILFERKKVD